MTDVATLEERLNRIEEPVVRAAREAELARLRTEAEEAQRDLVRIGAALADLGAQRRALVPRIAEAEAAWAAVRSEDARLAVQETALQRQHGLAWDSIHAAEIAGRPAPAPVVERRPLDIFSARELISAWFKRWRDRRPLPAPALRGDQYLAARVEIISPCVAGGEGRPVGWVGFVPDSEVDVLVGNNRAVVLERRIVADRQMPAVAMARAVRGTRGPNGEALAAGDVVPVDAPTRDAIKAGRLSALELVGPDVDLDRRAADIERQRLELEVRFPRGASQ
jgi:hypothetical protein